MIQKQTVYLPVKVEDEQNELQQEIDYWYRQTGSLTSETIVKRAYSLGLGKKLEATQGYFFTSKQLNEYTQSIIKQTLETAT